MKKIDLPIPNGKESKASVLNIAVLFANIVGLTESPSPHRVLTKRKLLQHHAKSFSRFISEYGGEVIKITDESVIGSFSDAGNAVRSAIEIRKKVNNTPKTEREQNQIFIKIAIHHGKETVQAEGITDSVVNLAGKIVSLAGENEIYLSQDVYNLAQNLPDVKFNQIEFIDKENEFHGINIYKIDQEQQEEQQRFFAPQDALAQDNEPPCFYCGNRTHIAPECPSKNILYISDSLEKAGYLRPEKLNKLFDDYLSDADSEANGIKKESHSLVKDLFFEIKLIYQLRFLSAIWGWGNLDWEKMRKKKSVREKTGPIWQAFDSLRSSSAPRAKEFLEKEILKFRKNHKLSIVFALTEIEQNDFPQALRYLDNALHIANTKTKKIFIHFLLFRIYELMGKFVQAKTKLREILLQDPECSEALYQAIVFDFKEQRKSKALSRLMMLVKKYREYYIKALIDPDLAPFSRDIHPKLRSLFNEAKEDADQLVPKAEKELGLLKKMVLYKNEQWFDEAQSLWDKIKKISGSGSYFGYLDKIRYATELLSIGQKVKEERKENIRKIVYELRPPCEKYFTLVVNFSYSVFIGELPDRLTAIHSELSEIERLVNSERPFNYKKIISQLKGLSSGLNVIHSIMQKRHTSMLFLQFLSFTLKFNAIFQGITLLIVFAGLPLLSYYSAFLDVPGQEFLAQHVGTFQKWLLVSGGIFWFSLSFVLGVRKIYGKQSKDFRTKFTSA